MMPVRAAALTIGGTALALMSAVATAQSMQSPGQWYINQQIYSTRVFNGVIANSMLRRGGQGSSPAETQPPAAVDPTRFTPGVARIAAMSFARQEGGSPDAQRLRIAEYDAHVDLYVRTAGKDGFPANDLAYAYQYFVTNSYLVYHDLIDVPPDRDPYLRGARDGFERIALAAQKRQAQVSLAQEQALYQQFRAQLGGSSAVRAMTDAQKQESTEMLAIAFGITYAGYMRAIDSGDDALRQDARRAAQQGLEKMLGRPISRIRIGYGGLEP